MPAQYSASAAASQASPNQVSLVVTSLRGTDSCAAVQMSAGGSVASVFQLVVTLDPSQDTQTLAPGTYDLGDRWQASYRLADALCASAGEGAAIQGSLEIDSVDTSVRGIVDVTFPQGRVIASFDAPFCGGSAVPNVACTQVPSCAVGQGTDLNPTPTETCNEIP